MIDMPVNAMDQYSNEKDWSEDLGIARANFTLENKNVKPWEEQREIYLERIKFYAQQDMPHLPQLESHEGTCFIVGSAPTVVNAIEEIRNVRKHPVDIIVSLNGAHGLLSKNWIIPNIHPLWEFDTPNLSVLGSEPNDGTRYYICSHCPIEVYKALNGSKCVLWHVFNGIQEHQDWISQYFPGEFMVGGAHASLFRALSICTILGFRKFEVYGCDSSIEDENKTHFDGYATPSPEKRVDVWGYNPQNKKVKKFRTVGSLAFTAKLFIEFCAALHPNLKIKVHGNGLLRYLHEMRYPDNYV